MKRTKIVYLLLIIILLLSGCYTGSSYYDDISNIEQDKKEEISNSDNFVLDYDDISLFENDLNSGKKVKGKTVKFKVNDYVPKSAMGINCWAGEHLNFISDYELNVKKGDIIIGLVKEEPTTFLGSWIIEYNIIEIQTNNDEIQIEDNNDTETNNNQEKENNNQEQSNNQDKGTSENDKSNDIDTEEKKETNKETYNYYTTNSNDVAKKGNKGKYSYIDRGGAYDIYWIIDFDNGYVYNFTEGNGNDICEKIKIKSGNLNDGLKLSYKDSNNAWVTYIHFKYKNQPHQLVIVDNDYFEYSYSTTSLEKALKLMKTKTMWRA